VTAAAGGNWSAAGGAPTQPYPARARSHGGAGAVHTPPKIQGGVGECGYSGSSSGGQPLPRTGPDPVPVSGGNFPQTAAAGGRARLQ
jgi:hypothetical protein